MIWSCNNKSVHGSMSCVTLCSRSSKTHWVKMIKSLIWWRLECINIKSEV